MEALWAARQNQLNGLAFQEVCLRYQIPFEIDLPNGQTKEIRDIAPKVLTGLTPNVQVQLPTLFEAAVGNDPLLPPISVLMKEAKYGKYSITQNGVQNVYQTLGIEPVILVSQAAHYSILKIANILGLGEKNVIHLPVDKEFRIDMGALHEIVHSLSENQVILALIGVLGTTQEGAIDPIDKLLTFRRKYEIEQNRSFWFHVDAAWGGYLKTLDPADACFSSEVGNALRCLGQADSITIDPHKMGYIPYPAGVINFQNKYAVLHSHQVAPYITLDHEEPNPLETSELDHAVGPYIIEGSKPGAAAVATWLTHKTVPLNAEGHGKLIKTSLENARRFYDYIKAAGKTVQKNPGFPFQLKPIGVPDCNVLCYYFEMQENGLLKIQNKLNQRIFRTFSLNNHGGKNQMPYGLEYFISHTHYFPSHYPFESVSHLLENLKDPQVEYKKSGLFLLRSVIINPWLNPARAKETNHLLNLVDKLCEVAQEEWLKMKVAVVTA